MLGLVLRTSVTVEEIRPAVGMIAAALAAFLAACAGWHVTDRLIAWRHRPDEE